MQFKQFLNEALKAFRNFSKEEIERLKTFKDMKIPMSLYWTGNFFELSFHTTDKRRVIIDNAKNEIVVPNEYEYSPYYVSAIEQLYKIHLFDDYKVITQEGITDLSSIIKNIKPVVGKYQTHASVKYDHKSTIKPFGIKIIKEIHDRNFYHATFKKHVNLIKKEGLKPSKIWDDIYDELVKSGKVQQGAGVPLDMIPQHGWSTSVNFDKQRAVYFFLDKKQALGLAEYLAYRNHEDAVVLEVNGQGLKNYSLLVSDEDSLRDEDSVNKRLKTNIPHFYHSALSHLRTIAYKGTISPQYIKVIAEFEKGEKNTRTSINAI